MNCRQADKAMVWHDAGELEPHAALELEQHCASCTRCAALAAHYRVLAGWLSAGRESAAPEAEAEERLLYQRATLLASLPEGSRSLLRSGRWGMPAALASTAVVLLCGFAGGWAARARVLPAAAASAAGLTPAQLRVEGIEAPAADAGLVTIQYVAVRQEKIAAPLNNQAVQQLLLQAVERPVNPGLRMDAIRLLSQPGVQSQNPMAVRTAFLTALRDDPNPGVRLRAVAALAPLVGADHPVVLTALADAAASDANDGVRAQAVHALAQTTAAAPLLRQLGSETTDPALRLSCAAALQRLRAGVPTQWLAASVGAR